ncbi:MAG: hypothetical protein HY922_06435 [Elusimicrobia bacterium]|nr:hypothetical protein [Elusimicrobiota bacterium]
MRRILRLLGFAALAAVPAGAAHALDFGPTDSRVHSIAYAGERAERAPDLQQASVLAAQGFDNAAQSQGFVSPPPVPALESVQKRPTGNLIIGDPKRATLSEPRNPLTKDGKAKPQKSGKQVAWALGGALALGLAGFLIGGGIGALVGALVGAALGAFLGP